MSLLAFIVALAAVAVVAVAYILSIRRLLELPLDGIELHPFNTADGWRILLYRHRRGQSHGEPILLVHGYSSNHWNLTAPRGVSLADYLADAGFDCWAIDLRGTRSSHAPPGTPRHRATFDGYVMHDLPSAIDYIQNVTGSSQVHWVGHSLGGTLLYAYELAHGRARVASGTTIASPPELRPGWPAWQSHLIRLMEYAPAAFSAVQRGLAPIHGFIRPRTRMVPIDWENLSPSLGVAEFFSAVETPTGPVTRTLEEFARHRYLAVDNDRVNVLAGLNRLETPLLVLGCPLDPIVPLPVLREFFDRLPTHDKKLIELSRTQGCERDHDHVDPPFAKNAATEVFAHITAWIKSHPVRTVGLPEPSTERALERETCGPIERERIGASREATSGGPAPLWGRALEDAAHILDGLDTDPSIAASRTAKARSKRRGPDIAAKQKTTTKRRATKRAEQEAPSRAKSEFAKPAMGAASRNNNRPRRAEEDRERVTAADADSDEEMQNSTSKKSKSRKKDKKKRGKSKDKSRKKKSKGKRSSQK